MVTQTTSLDWYSMSDPAIVKELCGILKQVRLQQNITQEQLAEKAGLSRSAISKMETGKSTVELLTLIQVLRALQQLHLLDTWKVTATISPLLIAKFTSKGRLRASGSTSNKI
jgi:transcriptional regulator with XRE-family HTH domain